MIIQAGGVKSPRRARFLPLRCCSVGSVPLDWLTHVPIAEGGSEPPNVSTTVRDDPARVQIQAWIFIWDIFPGSSSAEHLEVHARFPFAGSAGAVRDVAYFRGLFVLGSGQVQDGSRVSETERAGPCPGEEGDPWDCSFWSPFCRVTSLFPRLLI